jgi:hypothetical protein
VRSTTFASLPASLHFGLAVTATSSSLSTATFDNVSITGSSGAILAAAAEVERNTSGVATGSTGSIPDTDLDGDDVSDLIESILGGEDIFDGGWWLSTQFDGRIDAHFQHLSDITGYTFTLETSADLVNWRPLALSPTMVDLGGGLARSTWSGITSLSGQNRQHGIVRLRVNHKSGISATTSPQTWQQHALNPGTQTVGISMVNAPVYAGYVADVLSADTLLLNTTSEIPLLAGAPCYLEVRDGPNAGHRYDIANIEGNIVSLDLAARHNTRATLPPDIAGERVFIRPHITLGQAFPKTVFRGSIRQIISDQVLFHNGSTWETCWLMKNSARHQWVKSSGSKLDSQDQRIIPPGTGVMVKLAARPVTMTQVGHVRTTPFLMKLSAGHNFLAVPRPIDATPGTLNLTAAGGFNATSGPVTADQLQLWAADTKPQSSTYSTYWLSGNGWLPLSATSANPVTDSLMLPSRRAFFLKVSGPAAGRLWEVD